MGKVALQCENPADFANLLLGPDTGRSPHEASALPARARQHEKDRHRAILRVLQLIADPAARARHHLRAALVSRHEAGYLVR